jgi:hypothetical protein
MLSYSLEVSRGYVRLLRKGSSRPTRPRTPTAFVRRNGAWVERKPDSDDIDPALLDDAAHEDTTGANGPEPPDPDLESERDRLLHPRRGDAGMSSRSRMNMRRLFVSLPWELVGPRPALISLTYPGMWQPWVADGRAWEAQRRAFERRWVRRWAEPLVGVWVKEFQTSGRPHLHLYVGLPAAMSDEDFAGLRERTLLRHRLERRYGRWEGRNRTPPVGLPYGGEIGNWLRDTWSEIVGTTGRPDDWRLQVLGGGGAHHLHGVDVAVMFWSEAAEAKADRTLVAQYLAREAGKWRQKRPPAEFDRVGRFYGVWGRSVGFRPQTTITPLDPVVASEVEARLARWVTWKLRVLRQGAPPEHRLAVRRTGDGVTAFGLGSKQAERIVAWSEKAAARKQANGRQRGAGGEGPGALIELLTAADQLTGDILPPDQAEETAEGCESAADPGSEGAQSSVSDARSFTS